MSKLEGSTDMAASFQFEKEDHTLGNALRYIIMKKYVPLHPTRCLHCSYFFYLPV
jgi:DNA-directed RNA polymerase subunit L